MVLSYFVTTSDTKRIKIRAMKYAFILAIALDCFIILFDFDFEFDFFMMFALFIG